MDLMDLLRLGSVGVNGLDGLGDWDLLLGASLEVSWWI